ncbi:MAG: hypothetical protein ABIH39_01890 [Candidatus Margulisiibacteriota bacterium]
MEQKTKVIILITLITLAIIGFVVYKSKVQTIAPQQAQTNESQSNEQSVPEPAVIKEFFPEEITGRVVGMTSTSLIVDQPTGAIEVGIEVKTPVFKIEGSEKRAMSLVDIKAGIEITAKLNVRTGAVIEAVITQ